MTLEQEFQKQWTSLSNYLNSEIIKANNGDVDWNRIQSLFENEKRKWFLPGQYNNAWFEKLKRTDPEVAQKFEDALKSIKIKLIQQEIKALYLKKNGKNNIVFIKKFKLLYHTIIPVIMKLVIK